MKYIIALIENEEMVSKKAIFVHWEEEFTGTLEEAKKFAEELLKKWGGEIYLIYDENRNPLYANKDVPYILEK